MSHELVNSIPGKLNEDIYKGVSCAMMLFLNSLRFWRMVRAGRVSDVLGALEDAEGQGCQEVAGCHEASRWAQGEAGSF